MGAMRNAYGVVVLKPEGKRLFGTPRHRWDDNIRIGLREVGLGRCALDSSGSGLGLMAGSFEHGDEFSGSKKGGEFN
jgi:hypothetical protein